MRIMVVSDTHRRLENLEHAFKSEGPVDLVIHLGDVEGQELLIQSMASCPFYFIAGNNDYFSNLPREREIDIAGKHIFLTHGHQYMVGQGTTYVRAEARARKADIVMYGHTHKPLIEKEKEITVLCPGSISYPRQIGRQPSYLMITIDDRDIFYYQIRYMG